MHPDGVVHCKLFDDKFIDLDDRKSIVAALEDLYSGEKMSVVIETGERMDISKDAKYFDLESRIDRLVDREALVINSLPTRIAARFYYKLRKAPFPVKTFDNVEEAMEWVRESRQGYQQAN